MEETTKAEKTVIRICEDHQEYPVPLIWTFAFNGSEYWCPFCGFNGGMFGSGKEVPITAELKERRTRYEKFSKEFLHATGILVCVSTYFQGKRIPPSELPKEEQDRLAKIREEWDYGIEIETVPETPEKNES